MSVKMGCLICILLAGCSAEQTNKGNYHPQVLKQSGLYEMRAFLSNQECPSEKEKIHKTGLAPALLLAVAAPVLSETLKYGFSLMAKAGDKMAQPYPLNANIYPDVNTEITSAQCLTLVYGEFGGTGKNNIAMSAVPYVYYDIDPIKSQLTSAPGFAMQIKVQRSADRLAFIPFSLVYPQQLRPFGVNRYHGLTVAIDFGADDATMEFERIDVGHFYNAIAVNSHSSSIDIKKVTPYTMKITVTEGPDNQTLAGLLKGLSSSEVVAAQQKILTSYIDKKIAEKTGK